MDNKTFTTENFDNLKQVCEKIIAISNENVDGQLMAVQLICLADDIKEFISNPIVQNSGLIVNDKLRLECLNDWYGRQPFDNVEKITNVDIWNSPEADEIDLDDTETKSRDEILDEAKKVWNELSLEEKGNWRKEIGDEY